MATADATMRGNSRFSVGLDASAQITHELAIPDELIGYIIVHQGTKND